MLSVGDVAPDFCLPATGDKKTICLKDLRGKPVVVYFYPKDATPGCTTQAQDFRDNLEAFQGLGVQVLGISPDGIPSHERFAERQELNFPLLADEDKEAANLYGAWQLKKNFGREYMGIVRSTFLIDSEGKLHHIWPKVRVKGHVLEVLDHARQLVGHHA